MADLHDLTPEQQIELVQFARARLAEEKEQRLREIAVRESILDEAEAAMREIAARPGSDRSPEWKSVADMWPAYVSELVAGPYAEHPDYRPEWRR